MSSTAWRLARACVVPFGAAVRESRVGFFVLDCVRVSRSDLLAVLSFARALAVGEL